MTLTAVPQSLNRTALNRTLRFFCSPLLRCFEPTAAVPSSMRTMLNKGGTRRCRISLPKHAEFVRDGNNLATKRTKLLGMPSRRPSVQIARIKPAETTSPPPSVEPPLSVVVDLWQQTVDCFAQWTVKSARAFSPQTPRNAWSACSSLRRRSVSSPRTLHLCCCE